VCVPQTVLYNYQTLKKMFLVNIVDCQQASLMTIPDLIPSVCYRISTNKV